MIYYLEHFIVFNKYCNIYEMQLRVIVAEYHSVDVNKCFD